MANVKKEEWIISQEVFNGFIEILHKHCPDKSKNELRRLVNDKAVKSIASWDDEPIETTFKVGDPVQNNFTDPIDEIEFDWFCKRCLGQIPTSLGFFKIGKRIIINIGGEKEGWILDEEKEEWIKIGDNSSSI